MALEWCVEKEKGIDTKEPCKEALETDQKRMGRDREGRKRQVSGITLGQGEAGPREHCAGSTAHPDSQGAPRIYTE